MKDPRVTNVTETIVANLADVDIYKLTMLQFVWAKHRDVVVKLRFHNRTNVRLLDYIHIDVLHTELERVTKMVFPKECIDKLRSRYGHIFQDEFLTWLETLRLPMPDVGLSREGDLQIEATGLWCGVMLWETITMCIVNRLYFLGKMKELGINERDVLGMGKQCAHQKFARLQQTPGLQFTDFGTRRRWSLHHQADVLLLAADMLDEQFTGTSNVYLGLLFDLPLIGTMAHELTMAYQVIHHSEDEQADQLVSQKILWREWESFYKSELTVALTDTYGNDFGLGDFKEFAERWAGVRHDSGDPFAFGEKALALYERLGIDATKKVLVFSDGLTDELMIQLYNRFHTRIKVAFGWGTHLTNDMGFDVWPDDNRGLKPLSIVMKLVAVSTPSGWVETVKLSDNPAKATGPRRNVERIMRKTGYTVDEHTRVECEV